MAQQKAKAQWCGGHYVRTRDFETALRTFWESAPREARGVRDVVQAAAVEKQLDALDAWLCAQGYEGLQADDFCSKIDTAKHRGKGRYAFYFDDPDGRAVRHIMDFLRRTGGSFSAHALAPALCYVQESAAGEIFTPGYWAERSELLKETLRLLRQGDPSCPATQAAKTLASRLAAPEDSGLVFLRLDNGKTDVVDLDVDPKVLSDRLAKIIKRRLMRGGESTALLDFGAREILAFGQCQRSTFDVINREKTSPDEILKVFEEILQKAARLSGASDREAAWDPILCLRRIWEGLRGKDRPVQALTKEIDALEKRLPDVIQKTRRIADSMHQAAGTFEKFSAYFNVCSCLLEIAAEKFRPNASSTDARFEGDLGDRHTDLLHMAAVSAGAGQVARTVSDKNREAAIDLTRLQNERLPIVRSALIQIQLSGERSSKADMDAMLARIGELARTGEHALRGAQQAWERASTTFMTLPPLTGDAIPPLERLITLPFTDSRGLSRSGPT